MTDKTAREILREWSFVERCGHYPHTEVEKPCPHCDGTAHTILAALEAGGFAVVPKEPTEAMHGALIVCNMVRGDVLNYLTGKPEAVRDIWRHMIAASNPKEEGSDN